MRTTKQITRTENKTIYSCDICGASGKVRICYACKREVCHKHHLRSDFDIFTGDSMGDYYQILCTECRATANPYITRVHQLEEQIDAVIDEWTTRCQRNAKGE